MTEFVRDVAITSFLASHWVSWFVGYGRKGCKFSKFGVFFIFRVRIASLRQLGRFCAQSGE